MQKRTQSSSAGRPLRVACVAPYPWTTVGGQRFRFEQWFDLLPSGAVRVDFRPLWTDADHRLMYQQGRTAAKVGATVRAGIRRLVDAATVDADVALLFREALPLGPPVVERWLTARLPVVYDFDDAIFLGDVSATNAAIRPLKMPGKVARIVERATTTTVGNEYLARFARQHSSSVQVIPTTLDVDAYRPAPPPSGPITVGWSGSPTTAKHLATIGPAIRELTTVDGLRFHAYGAPGFVVAGAPGVSSSPWSRESEIATTQGFHIGVMPLPDDEWSRGKCGFKALLYMALGIPVVASPVGVNATIIEHGVNGLLADDHDDWLRAIRTLAEDPDLRARLGAAGRQTVEERYSGQRWAPVFLDTLIAAAGR